MAHELCQAFYDLVSVSDFLVCQFLVLFFFDLVSSNSGYRLVPHGTARSSCGVIAAWTALESTASSCFLPRAFFGGQAVLPSASLMRTEQLKGRRKELRSTTHARLVSIQSPLPGCCKQAMLRQTMLWLCRFSRDRLKIYAGF